VEYKGGALNTKFAQEKSEEEIVWSPILESEEFHEEALPQTEVDLSVQMHNYLEREASDYKFQATEIGINMVLNEKVYLKDEDKKSLPDSFWEKIYTPGDENEKPRVYSGSGPSLERHAYPVSCNGSKKLLMAISSRGDMKVDVFQRVEGGRLFLVEVRDREVDYAYCVDHKMFVMRRIMNTQLLIEENRLPSKEQKSVVWELMVNPVCKGKVCDSVRSLGLDLDISTVEGKLVSQTDIYFFRKYEIKGVKSQEPCDVIAKRNPYYVYVKGNKSLAEGKWKTRPCLDPQVMKMKFRYDIGDRSMFFLAFHVRDDVVQFVFKYCTCPYYVKYCAYKKKLYVEKKTLEKDLLGNEVEVSHWMIRVQETSVECLEDEEKSVVPVEADNW